MRVGAVDPGPESLAPGTALDRLFFSKLPSVGASPLADRSDSEVAWPPRTTSGSLQGVRARTDAHGLPL